MPQSYGITSNPHNDSTPTLSSPTEPLLGIPKPALRNGTASLLSGISNLANTIMGTGMLTFPLAMASAGIIPGVITCIFSGSMAAFGLYLLSLCATKTPHRQASFFAISQLTFPRAAIFFDVAIAIKCFGVSISYLIIIKSLMPSVVEALYHVLSPNDPPSWAMSGRIWVTLFMIILVPLCYQRQLDSLRHTSYIALFSVVYLVTIVVVCYFNPPIGSVEPGEIHMIHFTPSFVSTFPVQVFAFTCAQNLFPIYNEIASNTQERMNIVIGGSVGSAIITYEVISVFGYLTFGSKVGDNIILMYPATTPFIALGQLAIVILVLFSYPFQVHPCRGSLDKVFRSGISTKPVDGIFLPEETDDIVEDPDHASGDLSVLKHTLLTGLIVLSGYILAYFVDDLRLILAFVGSTGSTAISFILPAIFYYKLSNDAMVIEGNAASRKELITKWMAVGLGLYGCFIFVFCFGFNVWQVMRVP